MDFNKIIQLIDVINEIIVPHGFECIDVEYLNRSKTLRVYIDIIKQVRRINIDDCVVVSQILCNRSNIDELVGIEDYVLEVSSPGLERPIRKKQDFIKYVGKTVEINLDDKSFNFTKCRGILMGVISDDKVQLKTTQGIMQVSFDKIKKANLLYNQDKKF